MGGGRTPGGRGRTPGEGGGHLWEGEGHLGEGTGINCKNILAETRLMGRSSNINLYGKHLLLSVNLLLCYGSIDRRWNNL